MANSVQADSFLAKKPLLICTVLAVKFYEHPAHGNDVSMLYVDKGVLKYSGFYESPTIEEVSDLLRDN